jgi:hypothetical protein
MLSCITGIILCPCYRVLKIWLLCMVIIAPEIIVIVCVVGLVVMIAAI